MEKSLLIHVHSVWYRGAQAGPYALSTFPRVSLYSCQWAAPTGTTATHSLRLQRLLWIYCPGHAGVSGNERADRLASTADIISGLQLGRAEVLRGLRNFLNMDRPEHHSTDRLSGERKRPTFHPPSSRTICVQPGKYWHCFVGNLGETAERRGGARMGLSERYDAILS